MGRAVLAQTGSHVRCSAAAGGSAPGEGSEAPRSQTAAQKALSGGQTETSVGLDGYKARFTADDATPEQIFERERAVIADNVRHGFSTDTAFGALTPEQRFEFDIRGYIVLRGHYSPEQVGCLPAAGWG